MEGVTHMKKSAVLIVVVVVVIIGIMLSACGGGGRDLSTPSSRLVGHWKIELFVVEVHLYFDEIDKKTGEGSFAFYDKMLDSVYKGTYTIVNETPKGEDITILPIFFSDKDAPDISLYSQFSVQKDGLEAMNKFLFVEMEYVDGKTEYEPAK